eukprot:scaffold117846_cov31-Tisochrysis_lutea.AAC.1
MVHPKESPVTREAERRNRGGTVCCVSGARRPRGPATIDMPLIQDCFPIRHRRIKEGGRQEDKNAPGKQGSGPLPQKRQKHPPTPTTGT